MLRWLRLKSTSSQGPTGRPHRQSPHSTGARGALWYRVGLAMEPLEVRALLSVSPNPPTDAIVSSELGVFGQATFQAVGGLTPSAIQAAYGVNLAAVGGTALTGSGETIAIIDQLYDPYIASDLSAFSSAFSLPLPNTAGAPTFTQVGIDANGNVTAASNITPLPANPANSGGWGFETDLDVEWAHALAPRANIVLIEVNNVINDLAHAADYARNLSGVVAVSMSFGISQFGLSASSAAALDAHFAAASNHPIVFTASSGDSEAATIADGSTNPPTYVGNANGPFVSVNYPAASPNVLAVGGTIQSTSPEITWNEDLLNSSNQIVEFRGTGGGISNFSDSGFESEPSYQTSSLGSTLPSLAGNQAINNGRALPDVSFKAEFNDPEYPSLHGVDVYDAYDNQGTAGNWEDVGGTSLGAPAWAGLIADVDQGRAINGLSPISGTGQASLQQQLYALYSTQQQFGTSGYSNDFHDITSGNNDFWSAATGYDAVTGLGTPKFNALATDLADDRLRFTLPSSGNYTLKVVSGYFEVVSDSNPSVALAVRKVAATSAVIITGSSSGGDTLTVDSSVDAASLPVTFNGHGSNEGLNVADQGSTTARTYTVTNSSIALSNAGTVAYTGVASLTLTTSNAASDVVNVQSTVDNGTTTSVSITGLGATVNVGDASHALSSVAGALTVTGRAADTTTLNVNDANNATPSVFYFSNSNQLVEQLNNTLLARITYSQIANFSLTTGSGSTDEVFVQSVASGTATSVTALSGSALVEIGFPNGLSAINGSVTVNAGSNLSTLAIEDNSTLANVNYTVTSSQVTASDMPGSIHYSNQALLELFGSGGANDTVAVKSLGTRATISTLNGSIVNVGDASDPLSGIANPLSVTGATTLNINDSGQSSTSAYTVTNSSVSVSSGLTVSYSSVHALNLTTSAGSTDTVNVRSTVDNGTTTSVSVTGTGATVNVGDASNPLSNIVGALTITGKAGDSTRLNLNDIDDPTNNTSYTVSSNQLQETRNNTTLSTVSFSNIANLSLTGGTGAIDQMFITAVASGMTDAFVLSGQNSGANVGWANSLSAIAGNVTVSQSATSTGGISVSDFFSQANGVTYTVSNGRITASDLPGSITYQTNIAVAQLLMSSGSGATATVQSSGAADTLVQSSGTGAVINVGDSTHPLSNITGLMNAQGSTTSTEPTVNVNDSAQSSSSTYSVNSLTIQSTHSSTIQYLTVAAVNLTTSAGANDIVNVSSTIDSGTTTSVTITGTGATVNVGNASNPLSNIVGALSIVGKAGDSTRLNFNDVADPTDNASYTLSSSQLQDVINNTTLPAISFSNIPNLSLTGGTGNFDEVYVNSVASGMTDALVLSGPNSGTNIGWANSLSAIAGNVTVSQSAGSTGGVGVDDFASLANDVNYTVTNGRVTASDLPGSITYQTNIAFVQVTTTKGSGDTATVKSSQAGETTVMSFGTGTIINVGDSTDPLSGITGIMEAEGANTNTEPTVNVNDSAQTSSSNYTISTHVIQGTHTPEFVYFSVAAVNLTTSAGTNDVVNVQSTMDSGTTTAVTITGTGATVNVGGAGDPLSNIVGALTINGKAGDSTTLKLDDSANTSTAVLYTVTSSSVQPSTTASLINYANIKFLTLTTGGPGSEADIESTPANTTMTVNLGNTGQILGVQNFAALGGPLVVNGDVGKTASLHVNVASAASPETYNFATAGSGNTSVTNQTTGIAITYNDLALIELGFTSTTDTVNLGIMAQANGTGGTAANLWGATATEIDLTGGSDTINLNTTGAGNVTVAGHNGNQMIVNVQGTGTGSTTFDGGEGGNSFVVGAITNNVSNIHGTVTINGGNDGGEGNPPSYDDTLLVNDANDPRGYHVADDGSGHIYLEDASNNQIQLLVNYSQLGTVNP